MARGQRTDSTLRGLSGGEWGCGCFTNPLWKSFCSLGGKRDIIKTFTSQVLDELIGYPTLFLLVTNFLFLKGRNLTAQFGCRVQGSVTSLETVPFTFAF